LGGWAGTFWSIRCWREISSQNVSWWGFWPIQNKIKNRKNLTDALAWGSFQFFLVNEVANFALYRLTGNLEVLELSGFDYPWSSDSLSWEQKNSIVRKNVTKMTDSFFGCWVRWSLNDASSCFQIAVIDFLCRFWL
jgi:hypothetical protein